LIDSIDEGLILYSFFVHNLSLYVHYLANWERGP
jgi:hypothetical protein